MAQSENILTRLGKLFQSNIVIRKDNQGQLRVKDLDFTQSKLTSNFVDRYTRMMGAGSWGTQYASKHNATSAY